MTWTCPVVKRNSGDAGIQQKRSRVNVTILKIGATAIGGSQRNEETRAVEMHAVELKPLTVAALPGLLLLGQSLDEQNTMVMGN